MLVSVLPFLERWTLIILKAKGVHVIVAIWALALLFWLELSLINFAQIAIESIGSVICEIVTELPLDLQAMAVF